MKVFLSGGRKNSKLRKEFISYLKNVEVVTDLSQYDDCEVEVIFSNRHIHIHQNIFISAKTASVYLNHYVYHLLNEEDIFEEEE